MFFLIELLIVVAVFYLGKLHERCGSVGRAAAHVYLKMTGKVEKVVKDFNAGPTDPPSR